jgi:hypothetical protein
MNQLVPITSTTLPTLVTTTGEPCFNIVCVGLTAALDHSGHWRGTCD